MLATVTDALTLSVVFSWTLDDKLGVFEARVQM